MAEPIRADEASGVLNGSGGTFFTWPHTCTSTTAVKGILVVYIASRRNNTSAGTVTSVTWKRAGTEFSIGTIQLTKIPGAQIDVSETSPSNIYMRLDAWMTTLDAAGTGDIVVNFDVSTTRAVGISQTVYRSTSRVPEAIGTSATAVDGQTLSATVTSIKTNALLTGFFAIPSGSTNSMTAGTGTERLDANSGSLVPANSVIDPAEAKSVIN